MPNALVAITHDRDWYTVLQKVCSSLFKVVMYLIDFSSLLCRVITPFQALPLYPNKFMIQTRFVKRKVS